MLWSDILLRTYDMWCVGIRLYIQICCVCSENFTHLTKRWLHFCRVGWVLMGDRTWKIQRFETFGQKAAWFSTGNTWWYIFKKRCIVHYLVSLPEGRVDEFAPGEGYQLTLTCLGADGTSLIEVIWWQVGTLGQLNQLSKNHLQPSLLPQVRFLFDMPKGM